MHDDGDAATKIRALKLLSASSEAQKIFCAKCGHDYPTHKGDLLRIFRGRAALLNRESWERLVL